jgi:hypothetical protein
VIVRTVVRERVPPPMAVVGLALVPGRLAVAGLALVAGRPLGVCGNPRNAMGPPVQQVAERVPVSHRCLLWRISLYH